MELVSSIIFTVLCVLTSDLDQLFWSLCSLTMMVELPLVNSFHSNPSTFKNRRNRGHHVEIRNNPKVGKITRFENSSEHSLISLKEYTNAQHDNEAESVNSNNLLTSAVLKISYDGTHFCGWTGSENRSEVAKVLRPLPSPKHQLSKRSQILRRKECSSMNLEGSSNKIRTVEQTLRIALAKVYGSVPPNQVILDSCSRTDAGVHALSLIAQFYCRSFNKATENIEENHMNEWNLLRPVSSSDENFMPLPFNSNLSKLVFVLNRMLPPDVRVLAASPVPFVFIHTQDKTLPSHTDSCKIDVDNSRKFNDEQAFHPSLHIKSKTYTYRFATGHVHDPIQHRFVWHLDGSSGRAVGMNWRKFSLERAIQAANIFAPTGSADEFKTQPKDYRAFRSAFRGNERGKVQSTICTLWRCEILRERLEMRPHWEMSNTSNNCNSDRNVLFNGLSLFQNANNLETYTVTVTGDRFLYKMVRNIVGAIIAVACGHLEKESIHKALETGEWCCELRSGDQDHSNNDIISEKYDCDKENISPFLTDTSEAACKSCDFSMQVNTKGRSVRRICAPARGLTLTDVEFTENIKFDWRTG